MTKRRRSRSPTSRKRWARRRAARGEPRRAALCFSLDRFWGVGTRGGQRSSSARGGGGRGRPPTYPSAAPQLGSVGAPWLCWLLLSPQHWWGLLFFSPTSHRLRTSLWRSLRTIRSRPWCWTAITPRMRWAVRCGRSPLCAAVELCRCCSQPPSSFLLTQRLYVSKEADGTFLSAHVLTWLSDQLIDCCQGRERGTAVRSAQQTEMGQTRWPRHNRVNAVHISLPWGVAKRSRDLFIFT